MVAVGIGDANFPKTCSRFTGCRGSVGQKQGQHHSAPPAAFPPPTEGQTMKKEEMLVGRLGGWGCTGLERFEQTGTNVCSENNDGLWKSLPNN